MKHANISFHRELRLVTNLQVKKLRMYENILKNPCEAISKSRCSCILKKILTVSNRQLRQALATYVKPIEPIESNFIYHFTTDVLCSERSILEHLIDPDSPSIEIDRPIPADLTPIIVLRLKEINELVPQVLQNEDELQKCIYDISYAGFKLSGDLMGQRCMPIRKVNPHLQRRVMETLEEL
jgi:hypothetical protein